MSEEIKKTIEKIEDEQLENVSGGSVTTSIDDSVTAGIPRGSKNEVKGSCVI